MTIEGEKYMVSNCPWPKVSPLRYTQIGLAIYRWMLAMGAIAQPGHSHSRRMLLSHTSLQLRRA